MMQVDDRIIYGDAIEIMAEFEDQAFDVAITDPPYTARTTSKQRRGCTGYVEPTRPNATRAQFNRKRDLGFDALTPELVTATAEQLARLTRRWVLVFSDHEGSHDWRIALERAGLEYVRTMDWRKRGSTPQFTGDRPATACERIVLCHATKPNGKPMRKRWNGGGKHGFYDVPIVLNRGKRKQRVHTTQKPLELMRQLVEDFSDVGEFVLDPFAGSGTTGVAARLLEREFVGIERDQGYHAIARDRLQSCCGAAGKALRERIAAGDRELTGSAGSMVSDRAFPDEAPVPTV